ncbi:MAG: 30S ribosomal protein S16 [Planctomycetes bacterium]|nr:30S ribosomal protein S16 [Planctomycetota bacterium]
MSVRIRLKRMGRKNRAFFRIDVSEALTPRDGRTIENLGFYDPLVNDTKGVRLKINADRVLYWLGVGAQPSETVAQLLRQGGVALPEKKKEKRVRKRNQKAKAELRAAHERKASAAKK